MERQQRSDYDVRREVTGKQGDFDSEDRGGLSIGLSRCGGHVGDHASQRYYSNQHENNPSHTVPPCAIEPMRNLAITDQGSEQASSQAIPNQGCRPRLAERSERRADLLREELRLPAGWSLSGQAC